MQRGGAAGLGGDGEVTRRGGVGDTRVADLVGSIVQRAGQPGISKATLLAAPQLGQLRTLLQPELEHYGFAGYVVLDPGFTVVAAEHEEVIGLKLPPGYDERLRLCLAGEILVTPPFASVGMLRMRRAICAPPCQRCSRRRRCDRRTQGSRSLVPPDCAGEGFHPHPGHRPGRADRRDLCLRPDGVLLSESRFADELKRLR